MGYTTVPNFLTNKFLVNGNASFTGNIGVGTLSPTSKLHLNSGDFRLENGKLYLGSTPSSTPNLIDNQDVYGFITIKSMLMYNSGIVNFTIGRNDGVSNCSLDIGLAHVDYAWARVAKKGDIIVRGQTTGSFIFANENGGNIKFETTVDPSTDLTQYLTTKTRFVIEKNGSVGIGTGDTPINPNDLLAVNGLIHAKEVKVDLVGWPDFVFQNNYKLTSLTILEKEIEKLGHLPNVPSAKEVSENGVNLGEINKILLQKVEELTLYIIQMNKEIEKLKLKNQ